LILIFELRGLKSAAKHGNSLDARKMLAQSETFSDRGSLTPQYEL
jgi:hypothetical protein